MTQPIANARLRPMIAPTLAPVIISAAITSVYAVIAPWMPVTVVPTSLATVAIDTFITELSSVIRNCPAASVIRTTPDAFVATSVAALSGTLGRYRDALPRGGLRRLRRHDARGVESQLARPPQPVPGRVDRAQRRALGRHAVRAGRRGLPLLGAVLVGAHRPRARVDHD